MVQEEITLEALEAQPKDTYLLVDIRDEAAFQFGHMDGAIHIPANELPERHAELPKDQLLVIYCRSGIISEDGKRRGGKAPRPLRAGEHAPQ